MTQRPKKLRKKLLRISLALLTYVISVQGVAEPAMKKETKSQIIGQLLYTSLKTNKVAVSGQSLRAGFNYFITPRVAVEVGYFNMFLDDGSSLLSGFDFSGKWFPFSTGSEVTLTADRTMISSYSTWSPYLLGGYRMRDYTFEDTRNSYSGFSYGIGANWFLGKYFEIPLIDRLFTSFEASMAHFKSGPSKRLQTTNIGIGVGTSI